MHFCVAEYIFDMSYRSQHRKQSIMKFHILSILSIPGRKLLFEILIKFHVGEMQLVIHNYYDSKVSNCAGLLK